MKARINGQEYEFTANETILEVARRNGIFIPTLCEMHDIRHAPGTISGAPTDADITFLAEDTGSTREFVLSVIEQLKSE